MPLPDAPTIAVISPDLMLKLTLSNIGLNSGSAVGYLNVTFSNVIFCVKLILFTGFSTFLIKGVRSITSKIIAPNVLAAIIA